jgi:carbon storage regulator
MLIISRKKNETLVINNDVTITVVDIRGDKVRLGIVAPKEMWVHRGEVFEAIHGHLPHAPAWPAEVQAFLNAIQASPNDEGLRLVFADWLEEHGDPLAELLRLQCRLARLPAKDRRRPALARREQALWAEHGTARWAGLPAVLHRAPVISGPAT